MSERARLREKRSGVDVVAGPPEVTDLGSDDVATLRPVRWDAKRGRRLAAGAVLAALAAVVGVVLTDDANDDDRIGRAGSELVDDDPADPLPIDEVPTTYRVTYRVETPSGDEVAVTTDDLVVRRPFESVLRSHGGDTTGDELISETVASFGRLHIGGDRDTALVVANPPGVTPSDVRLRPALHEALSRGLLELGPRREVLGRLCQMYRSGEPLGSGSIEAPEPTEYTDTCIDAAGLVLEEILVVEEETLFRRLAVEVNESPRVTDADFAIDAEPLDVDRGGGSVLRMEEGSIPPTPFWTLPDAPEDFRSCGRFSVVPPQPENATDPTREPFLRSSTVDVWVDGPEVLLVEQGGTLGGSHPFALGSTSVDLGDLGEGDLVLGTQGNAVRALVAGGRYVQVAGTLPVEELAELARSLERVEGGTLEVIEGPPRRSC